MGLAHIVALVHIGYRKAGHAGLAPEPIGEQFVTCAGPHRTDAVEGGHDTLRAGVHDRQLKGPQVDLSHGLFIAPGGQALPLQFLLVERKVLVVHIDTLRLDADSFIGIDQAGEDAVFGVVLKYTAGVWGAVDVQTAAVDAGISGPHGVLADELAHLLHQLVIHGSGHDAVAGIAGPGHILVWVVGLVGIPIGSRRVRLCHTGGAVGIQGLRFANGLQGDGHPQAHST